MIEMSPCHILVVDDEPDLEQLMRQQMRREVRRGTYEFSFATDGRIALDMLANNQNIEIVLSDINMPIMDGLTLLENIPTVNDRLKAVMISAYGDMKNIRHAMNRGAFDFINKPIDFEDLKITISRTAEAVRMERENAENKDKLLSIQTELDMAARMQQSILPTRFPTSDGYNVFAHMDPAREVGGDFYDVRVLPNNHISVAIADVSGKGVPAALFMMSSRTLLRGATIGHRNPEHVLAEVNDLLSEQNDAMMFVTMFYATYSPDSRVMTFANGGHNLPVIFRADGTVEEIEPTAGVALGIMGDFEFEKQSVQLNVGDVVLLYTDGVNEAERSDEELFGMDRLKAVFGGETPHLKAHEVTDTVFAKVREYVGNFPQSDDITCLVLCVT